MMILLRKMHEDTITFQSYLAGHVINQNTKRFCKNMLSKIDIVITDAGKGGAGIIEAVDDVNDCRNTA